MSRRRAAPERTTDSRKPRSSLRKAVVLLLVGLGALTLTIVALVVGGASLTLVLVGLSVGPVALLAYGPFRQDIVSFIYAGMIVLVGVSLLLLRLTEGP